MAAPRKGTTVQLAFLPETRPVVDLAAERRSLAARASAREGDDRIAFARAATASVLVRYWDGICATAGQRLPIRLGPIDSIEVPADSFCDYADACVALKSIEAFYQIGELYTSLLPDEYRTKHGIYYTPPPLVRRLLDLAEAHGVDWRTARVLDPACGGAAFIAYVAQRMLAANSALTAENRLRDLQTRLVGLDVDPFATWLSAVLLDVVCLPVLRESNRMLTGIVRRADALAQTSRDLGEFDLVIGNPPYGKLTLAPEQRARFSRSLYGHANLYGLFTDMAVTLTKPDGLIAYVTPTSFLGGEYFKNLRRFLLAETEPVQASFVSDREGVFSNVLQETSLTVFRRLGPARRTRVGKPHPRIAVEVICPRPDGRADVDHLGKIAMDRNDGAPWVLPRSRAQLSLVRQIGRMPARLADYGYRVATGQLVWNRHKSQFRDGPGKECHPVLWAECIQPDGTFVFRAENRNHRPFLRVEADQRFLINHEPCVLVQRTTSKEQPRRLVAAAIPNSFVVAHPGYVVENHVNMLVPTCLRPVISQDLLARLLNSATVDHAFRCISGSVAVSAYELESLPLPDAGVLARRSAFVRAASGPAAFEDVIRSLYEEG